MDTPILTAVIAAATALLVTGLTNYLTKAREREADWRRLKLERYRAYVSALSGIVEGSATSEAHRHYADAVNELQLVGSPQVLRTLKAFLAYTSYRNPQRQQERHDELLSELIRAMRRDLQPKEKSDDSERGFWLQAAPPVTEPSSGAAQRGREAPNSTVGPEISETFGRDLEILSDQYVAGSIHWRLSKRLREALENDLSSLEDFAWILLVSADGHAEKALFHLFRLFDQHPDALSLPRLVRIACSNPRLFIGRVGDFAQNEHRRILKECAPLAGNLKGQRDKYFGHLDASLRRGTVTQILAAYPLSQENVEQLWSIAAELLKDYHRLLRGTDYEMDEPIEDDEIGGLLRHLREGRRS